MDLELIIADMNKSQMQDAIEIISHKLSADR